MPSGAAQGYLVQCLINGGVDETGNEVTNYKRTAIVGVLNGASVPMVPFVVGETTERSATHGYIKALNDFVASGGGGGVTDHGALTGLGDDDHTQYILVAGTRAFTGNQSMGNHKLTSVSPATTNGDALVYPLDVSTSAVTGALPFLHGGTGLTSLGTAFQSIRVNAGATALEFYTPSAGLTGPVNPTDDTKVAIASGGNLTYAFIGNTQVSSSAAIVLSKLANGSACSLVGVAANSSGAHADIQAGTNGFVYLRRSNVVTTALLLDENCDPAMALAFSKLAPGTSGRWLTINASGVVIESDTALASKTIQQSSADAVSASVRVQKSRGTPGAEANVSDNDPAEFIGTLRLGGAWVDVGAVRWIRKSDGYYWLQTLAHDGTNYRVVTETCWAQFTSSGDGNNNRFVVAIAADEKVRIHHWAEGLGPSNKGVFREEFIFLRRKGSADAVEMSRTEIVPLDNTDDSNWAIGDTLNTTDMTFWDNGNTSTSITWRHRITVERD